VLLLAEPLEPDAPETVPLVPLELPACETPEPPEDVPTCPELPLLVTSPPPLLDEPDSTVRDGGHPSRMVPDKATRMDRDLFIVFLTAVR
jgi:hypothetical protein